MTALRAETADDAAARRPHCARLAREAHMRLEIAKALKEHEGAIAVVCGAWHVPALGRKVAAARRSRDCSRRGRGRRSRSTWVPWTDAAAGGGVAATAPASSRPAGTRHLWSLRRSAGSVTAAAFAATWQAKVAGLLRVEGHAAARPPRSSRRRGSAIDARRPARARDARPRRDARGARSRRSATATRRRSA